MSCRAWRYRSFWLLSKRRGCREYRGAEYQIGNAGFQNANWFGKKWSPSVAPFGRRVEVDVYDYANPASAGCESLGIRRRSVSKEAPLQNSFRERGGRKRPSINCERDAMELSFTRENPSGKNPFWNRKKNLVRTLDDLCADDKRGPQYFAAGYLILAVLLRRRWLLAVAMHWRHRARHADQGAECAMI
jgi:hypothetical protein